MIETSSIILSKHLNNTVDPIHTDWNPIHTPD